MWLTCALTAIGCAFGLTACGDSSVIDFIQENMTGYGVCTYTLMVNGSVYGTVDCSLTSVNTGTAGTDYIYLQAVPDDIDVPGYTFVGWYYDEGTWCKPVETKIARGGYDTEAETVYAKLYRNVYVITYDGADGATNTNPTLYTIDSSFTLAEAEKEGYTFLGWYNGDTKVTEILLGSTGDVTLTAKWESTAAAQ